MSLEVTKSKKDQDGDILGLCGSTWSDNKQTAVAKIQRESRAYFVSTNGRTVYVRVGVRNGRNYLTTAPDDYSPNNLDDLPNC